MGQSDLLRARTNGRSACAGQGLVAQNYKKSTCLLDSRKINYWDSYGDPLTMQRYSIPICQLTTGKLWRLGPCGDKHKAILG